jgi:hypothetical protein
MIDGIPIFDCVIHVYDMTDENVSSQPTARHLGQGLDVALKQIDVQVNDMGARSFKLYNGHSEGSRRCDDKELAHPLYAVAPPGSAGRIVAR